MREALAWLAACGIFVALFYGGSFRRVFAYLGVLCVSTAMILANPIEPRAAALAVNNVIGATVCALPFWWAWKKWQRGRL